MTKHKIQNKSKIQNSKSKTKVLCFVLCVLNLFCALNFVIWISYFAYSEEKFIYDSHGRRDPFIPLVGLSRTDVGVSEIISIDDVDFQGIAKDAKGKRIIIVNGEMLRKGSKLGALTVKQISDDEAIVIIREKEYNLNLYEKEGGESD